MKTVKVRRGEFLETTASCSGSLDMTRDREAQEDRGASSRGLLRGLGQRAGGRGHQGWPWQPVALPGVGALHLFWFLTWVAVPGGVRD